MAEILECHDCGHAGLKESFSKETRSPESQYFICPRCKSTRVSSSNSELCFICRKEIAEHEGMCWDCAVAHDRHI